MDILPSIADERLEIDNGFCNVDTLENVRFAGIKAHFFESHNELIDKRTKEEGAKSNETDRAFSI